jgi:hypothetical protein
MGAIDAGAHIGGDDEKPSAGPAFAMRRPATEETESCRAECIMIREPRKSFPDSRRCPRHESCRVRLSEGFFGLQSALFVKFVFF